MNGQEIQQVNDTKYLGVYLDENLTWLSHFEKLYVKVMSKLAILRQLSKILSKHIINITY